MAEHTQRWQASDMLSSLQSRASRLFWFGATLSSVGQAAFLVSSGWLAFQLAGSGAVGLVTFATTGPLLFATLAGGVLADRSDRRKVVLSTQCVQGTVALFVGVLAVAGKLPLWALTVLVFVSGVARAVEMPTVQSVLPSLVAPEEMLNAFSLNGLATRGSRFIGPALVAPILATRGAGLAFLLVALIYMPAFAFIFRVPSLRKPHSSTLSIGEQIREGAQYIFSRSVLSIFLLVVVLHCLLTMAFDSTLPLFAAQNLRGNGAIYSTLIAAMGAGSIISGLILAGLRARRIQGTLLLVMGIASGLSTIWMSVTMVEWSSLVALFVVGATTAFFMTLANTMVAEAAPDHLRGRVSGIFLMSAGGMMSIGNLFNGYLAGRFGASPVVGLPAAVFIVLLLLIYAGQPMLRRVFTEGVLLTPIAPEPALATISGDD